MELNTLNETRTCQRCGLTFTPEILYDTHDWCGCNENSMRFVGHMRLDVASDIVFDNPDKTYYTDSSNEDDNYVYLYELLPISGGVLIAPH